MNTRNVLAAFVSPLVAALVVTACAAPVESDEVVPAIDDTLETSAYSVAIKEPTCCASTGCCKEWCTYRRDTCKGTTCWADWVSCNNRCENTTH